MAKQGIGNFKGGRELNDQNVRRKISETIELQKKIDKVGNIELKPKLNGDFSFNWMNYGQKNNENVVLYGANPDADEFYAFPKEAELKALQSHYLTVNQEIQVLHKQVLAETDAAKKAQLQKLHTEKSEDYTKTYAKWAALKKEEAAWIETHSKDVTESKKEIGNGESPEAEASAENNQNNLDPEEEVEKISLPTPIYSGEIAAEKNMERIRDSYFDELVTPFDVRLLRTDLFTNGMDRVPFSNKEASSILADLLEGFEPYNMTGDKNNPNYSKFARPAANTKKQYAIMMNDPDTYGLLSLINPYSVTRVFNGLGGLKFSGKEVYLKENRMLDIRDQKRFYDIKTSKYEDNLSVSNPTTSNIIYLMSNDRWGRTPFTYQDFVFCKYWNRIPNNRMIVLRKYAAPTYDNLCWEYMGLDKDSMKTSFAPIATAVTFFGGDSGNSLKDLLKITSGLNWEEIEANIWDVTGDAGSEYGETMDKNDGLKSISSGMSSDPYSLGNNLVGSMFNYGGKLMNRSVSMLKFLGIALNGNTFDYQNEIYADKIYGLLHDPNDNGPYANRIKGPLNRINKVYKRKEGIKFDHKMSLKFSYKARPIGGVNTKVAMMEIISNMLLMCSTSAVFWGGGHKFMIQPHAYPWAGVNYNGVTIDGLMKSLYNGDIFGQKGAIAQVLSGVALVGSGKAGGNDEGGFYSNVMKFMQGLGAGVAGAFGGALNMLTGILSGAGMGSLSSYVSKAANIINGAGNSLSEEGRAKGNDAFNNLIKNAQDVWKSNAIKSSVLPQVEGMRSVLLGLPVGNWHLTIGNPLNPIAVIGNLIVQDVNFEFGEELGPDDFPDELNCTVTLEHGMPRDLASIESMFNNGAGRIYQAPDYIKMWGTLPSSEQETKVDAVTGGVAVRHPAAFTMVDGKANAGRYYDLSDGKPLTNQGEPSKQIHTPINERSVEDYNRIFESISTSTSYSRKSSKIRAAVMGSIHTRHYTD